MNKGYLICKSALDDIEEFQMEQSALDSWKEGEQVKKVEEGGVTVIKCPLTGTLIQKSKIRKVYFC